MKLSVNVLCISETYLLLSEKTGTKYKYSKTIK